MSRVFFISDLHFGHKKIVQFGNQNGISLRSGDTYVENMHIIAQNCIDTVTKRDLLYILGDAAFTEDGLEAIKEIPGRKILVRGNHDNYFKTEQLLRVFESIEGLVRYKNAWLSHAPIHPAELRGKINIHGHVHNQSIRNQYTGEYDERYINVCCEAVGEKPISYQEIIDGTYQKIRKC